MVCKTISESERIFLCSNGLNDSDRGTPANLPAYFVVELDDILAQEPLQEWCGSASFMADDRSIIATTPARLSKQFNLGLIDLPEASHEAYSKI